MMTKQQKTDYLLKKKNESLSIMSTTTNDKKYYSAERQLEFCNKNLKSK